MTREVRIVEIREEIDRVLSQTDATHKANSMPRLLRDKRPGLWWCLNVAISALRSLDCLLKTKLQRLETQKRAALDSEEIIRGCGRG